MVLFILVVNLAPKYIASGLFYLKFKHTNYFSNPLLLKGVSHDFLSLNTSKISTKFHFFSHIFEEKNDGASGIFIEIQAKNVSI